MISKSVERFKVSVDTENSMWGLDHEELVCHTRLDLDKEETLHPVFTVNVPHNALQFRHWVHFEETV